MPTITLNKNVFEKLVGKKLPIELLKNRIDMLGTGLEKIEGNEIHVEIFPNRPDLLSEQGFARAFATFIGAKKGLQKYNVEKGKKQVIIDKSVEAVRPFTACAIVKNLKLDDEKIREIIQIQEKLHVTYGRNRKRCAIGIYPSEKITYPITFLAKKPEDIKFKALEAEKIMNAKQILENHSTGKEFAHLLKDKSTYPIFVDAKGKILSMPPIINSDDVGRVTEQTKEVFIECSGFDYNVLSKCINMIVTAFADLGGKIESMELVYGKKKFVSPDLTPEEMKVDFDYINKRLGLELKEADFKKCFEKMGYDYKAKKVLIPAYRCDILHQADLAEDVAIAYGYENIKPEIPKVATVAAESKTYKFTKKISEIFVGLGFLETSTFHLTDKLSETKKMCANHDLIELENSISEEFNFLRKNMLPSLMKVLEKNKHHELPQKIFEAGIVFSKDKSFETGIKETRVLAGIITNTQTNYTEIRQALDYMFSAINLECKVKSKDESTFIVGRAGEIIVNGKKIGVIGEISPNVLANFNLNTPASAFELDLDELLKLI